MLLLAMKVRYWERPPSATYLPSTTRIRGRGRPVFSNCAAKKGGVPVEEEEEEEEVNMILRSPSGWGPFWLLLLPGLRAGPKICMAV